MIDLKSAEFIHFKSVEEFGGSQGTRDHGALDAALNRPFATFDGADLYPTSIDKAAALLESIVCNHPFIDGNKRTGYLPMKYLLFKNGILLTASNEEKYQLVIEVSKGEIGFEEIKLWLTAHSKNI